MNDEVQLVIFDCDGVLVDSERLSIKINVEVLGDFGIVMSEAEVIAKFMGRSEGLIFSAIEEHIGRPLTEEELTEMYARFHASFDADLTPVDGIAEALSVITHRVCVASSSKPEGLRHKLGHCGLLERFGGNVFSASQVKQGKPAPDLFLFAAATMGVDPAACVVVEDSPYGVQAARAAGMRSFAYLGGMIAEQKLAGDGTVLFSDMRELPRLLAS